MDSTLTKGKLIFNFDKRIKGMKKENTLLTGTNGSYSLKVVAWDKQTVCNLSHQLIGYNVVTLAGVLVAKVAFQRDAKTLITILEGHTYSTEGLTWNEASTSGNTFIHLKDTSMIPKHIVREITQLLPKVTVLTADSKPKGRVRKVRKQVGVKIAKPLFE